MKKTTTSKAVKVTSALALTLALGGGLVATTAVHADPAAKASDALQNKRTAPMGSHILKPPGEAERGLGPWFGPHAEEVLSVLGITKDELKEAIKADKSLAEIAASKKVETQTLIDKLVATEKKELQLQLTDSKITQTQYNERLAALTERVSELVNEKPSALRAKKPEHPAPGMGLPGRGFGPEVDRNLDKLASLLGVTTNELTSSLKKGDTLAAIASAQKVNVQTLIQQLATDRTADLQQELKDGKITQAQYDERVADLTQRITDLVNGKRPSVQPEHHHGSRLKDESGTPVKPLPENDKTDKAGTTDQAGTSTSDLSKDPA
ncbi:LysM peptidoglycan-binding domain-containing protein [Paenibacillus polysaccharolyticus]|uniref:LysM peptidoglycan-binding domain-containing protein n=1 Tax=Paenibacillus polysaccharolyticus TaxID=582692 RepID=UPI0012B961A4|nr:MULTISPECIES: LysM peptidoglycan-binding domain-containing protein [Paenibacillus]